MSYTLEEFSADSRAALLKDSGPAGRELVRQYTEKACSDPEFIARYLGPGATDERRILYEDPELHFMSIREQRLARRTIMAPVGRSTVRLWVSLK